MDDFPSNSQRSKETSTKPPKPAPKKEAINPVVTNPAARRKKSVGKRFRETFAGGDAKSVWSYVVMDVLIPAAKDMVADATTQGVERLIFGEVRRSGYRPGGRGSVSGYSSPHTNYQKPPWQRDARTEPSRQLSRQARAMHNFDEIVLENRGDAEMVLDGLYNLLERFDVVTVSDLYDLAGITGSYTDRNWGWTNLKGAGATPVRGGFLLNLPQPEPVN